MAKGENDIIVKLYGMPDHSDFLRRMDEEGVSIRRMMPVNTSETLRFIEGNFGELWADEARFAMMHRNCIIAVKDRRLVGFVCVDATAKGYVGPIGVTEEMRGKGVARALFYRAMLALRDMGYKYAVAGMTRADFAKNIARNYSVIVVDDEAASYEDMIDPTIA